MMHGRLSDLIMVLIVAHMSQAQACKLLYNGSSQTKLGRKCYFLTYIYLLSESELNHTC